MKCPNCGEENYGRIVYGYYDDSDESLRERDGKDIWLAGCVPDSYGKWSNDEEDWVYPIKRCNSCKTFYDYRTEQNGAFMEGYVMSDDSDPRLESGGYWDDHDDYPVSDWQYEVANGDTRQGYHEWRAACHERDVMDTMSKNWGNDGSEENLGERDKGDRKE